MTVWLTNPPKKRRKARKSTARRRTAKRSKRKPPKGFRTWSAYMASIRPGARKKRKRRRTSTSKGVAPVARRKRKRTTAKRTSTRRRRSYRRNPPTSKRITNGLVDAAYAVAGKAAVRAATNLLPASLPQPVRLAGQAVAAVVVGMVADRVAPRGAADAVLIGALMAPIEAAIQHLNVPVIAGALSAYPTLQPYPGRRAITPGMAAYPTARAVGAVAFNQ